MTFCFRLKQKHPEKKRASGGCKSEFGENDHRSPSNRAQLHAYGQNACGVILPTSRPQTSKKKRKKKNKIKKATHAKYGAFTFIIANCKTKTIQESNSKQITFTDYTILNACPDKSARCSPPYHTPSTSSPKAV